MGVTAHWIKVTDGEWKLQAEVVGFQLISGDHSGENMGKYFVGLCDCVGTTSEKDSKVCHKAVLDKPVDNLGCSFRV